MLKYIPTIITDDQNAQIIEMPDEVKIKNTVFGLNSDSAGGPDEYTAKKKISGLLEHNCQSYDKDGEVIFLCP